VEIEIIYIRYLQTELTKIKAKLESVEKKLTEKIVIEDMSTNEYTLNKILSSGNILDAL
jgi:hypothetical protein